MPKMSQVVAEFERTIDQVEEELAFHVQRIVDMKGGYGIQPNKYWHGFADHLLTYCYTGVWEAKDFPYGVYELDSARNLYLMLPAHLAERIADKLEEGIERIAAKEETTKRANLRGNRPEPIFITAAEAKDKPAVTSQVATRDIVDVQVDWEEDYPFFAGL